MPRKRQAVATILVVEDEPNIADFLKRGLAHSGFNVEVAGTGLKGLDVAESLAPDLVVLDLTLPDVDGIDVCRQLRAAGDVGIVVLTAREMVGDRVRGLEAGADDYIPKPFAFEELLARIRSVLRRRAPAADGVVQVADIVIDVERRQVRRGTRQIDLTTREFDLLKLLAQNAGKPVRRDTILQRIWGYEFESSTDPLKVYVNYLRRKLNAEGEPDLILALRGFGYVLKEKA